LNAHVRFRTTAAVAVEIETQPQHRQCSPSLLALSTHVARAVPLFSACVRILICISAVLIASLASLARHENEQVGGGPIVAQLLVGVDRLSEWAVLVGGNCTRYGTGDRAKCR
jgi:hypothetical protein